MDPWIEEHAAGLAARAERDLEALVAVSSPSGDLAAAEEVVAVATALAPGSAEVTRLPCSSAEHAPDLLLRVTGPGERRVLLVGHLDTVVSHTAHVPPARTGPLMRGSGTIDMKSGVALSLGVLRVLNELPGLGEAALLLVNDEEWRTSPFMHGPRFAGFDACLCFEAGEHDPDGNDAVVVRRKAAGSIRVRAHGRAAHSGSAPDKGVNALLALARVATTVAARHDPQGPDRLTAVPTIMSSGDALNVVPAAGDLVCDVRADRLEALREVLAVIPEEVGGARIEAEMQREWPGMDARDDGRRHARPRRRPARPPGHRRPARRSERRQPLRRGDPRHDRRPRSPWRPRAPPRRIRRSAVAAARGRRSRSRSRTPSCRPR